MALDYYDDDTCSLLDHRAQPHQSINEDYLGSPTTLQPADRDHEPAQSVRTRTRPDRPCPDVE
jgi:hypothetical protein